jgi:hypothetical protein
MLGGSISSAPPAARFRAQLISAGIGLASLTFTSFFGRRALASIEVAFTDLSAGLLVACIGLFFVPVLVLSSFGPQCVQYLATRGTPPGQASGLVYGISTLGNIAGVMLTAFALIPHFRVSTLLYLWLGVAVVSVSALIAILRTGSPRVKL